jgi:hypothetical protein
MKNLTTPTTFRKSLFSLLVVAIGMFSISSTNVNVQQEVSYQILNPKAFIAGSGKLKNMKTVINSFDFSGKFVGRTGELGDITDFNFSLPVEQLIGNKEINGSTIEQALLSNGCKEIAFVQKNIMILPIMKKVYMGGDVKMTDDSYSFPMYLQYEIGDDQQIKVTGTQHIRLSQFGIKNPSIVAGAMEDEIVINIEFTLAKKQQVVAAEFSN